MRIAKNTKYYGPLNLTDISIKYKVDIYKSIKGFAPRLTKFFAPVV